MFQSRKEENVLGSTGNEVQVSVQTTKKSSLLYLLRRMQVSSSSTRAISLGSREKQVQTSFLGHILFFLFLEFKVRLSKQSFEVIFQFLNYLNKLKKNGKVFFLRKRRHFQIPTKNPDEKFSFLFQGYSRTTSAILQCINNIFLT